MQPSANRLPLIRQPSVQSLSIDYEQASRKIMTRKPNESDAEAIKRYLHQNARRQLKGQSNKPHYNKTKSQSISCALCSADGGRLERHRINPYGEYTDENVTIVCNSCHKLIHRIYNERNASNDIEYRLAILQARFEIAGE